MAQIRMQYGSTVKKDIKTTYAIVKNGVLKNQFNIIDTDYTNQGSPNIIIPTISQKEGYVELKTNHTIMSSSGWWDSILYNTFTQNQIEIIRQCNRCKVDFDFVFPTANYTTSRVIAFYNGVGAASLILLYNDATSSNYEFNISNIFQFDVSSTAFDKFVIGTQKHTDQSLGEYIIRIRDLYFYKE